MLLWDVLARSSAVLVVACLASAALRGRSASLRHAVWALGIAGALAIAPLSWVLPTWHVPLVPAFIAETSAPVATPVAAAARDLTPVTPAAAVETAPVERPKTRVAAPTAAPITGMPAPAAPSARMAAQPPAAPSLLSRARGRMAGRAWPALLVALWAMGTIVLLLRLALANLRTARAIRRRTTEPAPWLAKARRLARVSGVPRTRFVRSGTIAMPMAAGVLRPTVVLPV